jgi:hypothetical protein
MSANKDQTPTKKKKERKKKIKNLNFIVMVGGYTLSTTDFHGCLKTLYSELGNTLN